MKFYIVDEECDLKGGDDWVDKYEDAQQFSFKEARDMCRKYNGEMKGEIGVFFSMIPVPKEDEKEVSDKSEQLYYIIDKQDGYWKSAGNGYTKDKSQAFKYSKKAAESACENKINTMEPADD